MVLGTRRLARRRGIISRLGLQKKVVTVSVICLAVFITGNLVKADTSISDIATAEEVTQYLSNNPGASVNDVVGNFADDVVIELPAGDYVLSDNLVIDRRLVLRGAPDTTPDEVVIDGASWWDGDVFMPGYYIDIAYAGSMIEGVTLTHLGTSSIDWGANHSMDAIEMSTGYSIAVRGGTLNRCIIVDNISNYVTSYDRRYGGALIGLLGGTLSGSLIAHNGITNTSDQYKVTYNDEIILAAGASHLIGNTITNNTSSYLHGHYLRDNLWGKSIRGATVNLYGDPILQNNVVVGNTYYNTFESGSLISNSNLSFSSANGDYYDFSGVTTNANATAVKYMGNWIHKDTENNLLAPVYINQDFETQLNNYRELFVNMSKTSGAWTYPGSSGKPDYNYTPRAGSSLIDAGSDVFYPVIQDDLAGQSHFLGDAPDLGAYESNGTTPNFTPYSSGIVYVTEHGAGNKDGTSWQNAMDGNSEGGVQDALIAMVRGGGDEVWIAKGEYNVPGRELLYTYTIDRYYIDTGLVGGVWSGILFAPTSNPQEKKATAIYGGFNGNETSINERPTFTYINNEGADTGVKLVGASQDNMTHLIGERGYALTGDPAIGGSGYINFYTSRISDDDFELTKVQPDQYNLINQDTPTVRQPTLPSQGVHVISQVDYARDSEESFFRPVIDGVEISNGFNATYSPINIGTEMSVSNGVQGGAGIYLHGGYVKNVYVHDNYDAVASFVNWFMFCGGGMFADRAVVENAVVTNNVSETTGGGILSSGSSIKNSYVAGNYAFKEGGGIHTGASHSGGNHPATPEIINTVVTNNKTLTIPTEIFTQPSGNGGGIWMSDANSTKIQDVTVFGNSATGDGKTTGLGDNIYMAGGELTNVVSLGAEHVIDDSTAICSTDEDLTIIIAGGGLYGTVLSLGGGVGY
ncbi:MAG: hypothetical protein LBQ02_03675 [Candidatus Nomurabacteria bacterium]|nr:hypothetical protein [Candidatus Nomurabacteria bacterium]